MELAKTVAFHVVLALFMAGTIFLAVWIDMTSDTRHLVPLFAALALVGLDKWARRRFWPNAR